MTGRVLVEKVKQIFFRRQYAYQKVFNSQNVFTEEVLQDLARFCRAHKSTFHEDPRLHAMLEGRREVWIRIEQYLKLTPDEIWQLHKGDLNG